MQLVSGVSILAYWSTTFLWDFLSYQISMWCCIWILVGFNVTELIGNSDTIRATILLFFFHGIAAAGLCYILTYFYKSPSSAQNTMIFLNVRRVVPGVVEFWRGSSCSSTSSMTPWQLQWTRSKRARFLERARVPAIQRAPSSTARWRPMPKLLSCARCATTFRGKML